MLFFNDINQEYHSLRLSLLKFLSECGDFPKSSTMSSASRSSGSSYQYKPQPVSPYLNSVYPPPKPGSSYQSSVHQPSKTYPQSVKVPEKYSYSSSAARSKEKCK